jgi:uncharacterized protein with von Willebrand factor type A (vWA) domain
VLQARAAVVQWLLRSRAVVLPGAVPVVTTVNVLTSRAAAVVLSRAATLTANATVETTANALASRAAVVGKPKPRTLSVQPQPRRIDMCAHYLSFLVRLESV